MTSINVDGTEIPVALVLVVAILLYIVLVLIIIVMYSHFRSHTSWEAENGTEQRQCCDPCCSLLATCCPCSALSLQTLLKPICPKRKLVVRDMFTCECLRPTVHGSRGATGLNLVCCEVANR